MHSTAPGTMCVSTSQRTLHTNVLVREPCDTSTYVSAINLVFAGLVRGQIVENVREQQHVCEQHGLEQTTAAQSSLDPNPLYNRYFLLNRFSSTAAGIRHDTGGVASTEFSPRLRFGPPRPLGAGGPFSSPLVIHVRVHTDFEMSGTRFVKLKL